MRIENDAIRQMPLHIQEQVGVAIASQLAQASPVAGQQKGESEMLRCDPRAFARCPYKGSCGRIEDAEFPEDSDCHKFNRRILSTPVTVSDDIRAKSDPQLFLFLYTLISSCKAGDCGACPIGEKNCSNLRNWLKSESKEGNE